MIKEKSQTLIYRAQVFPLVIQVKLVSLLNCSFATPHPRKQVKEEEFILVLISKVRGHRLCCFPAIVRQKTMGEDHGVAKLPTS